ncbi:MAG: hypothetical protein S4CHLAM37_05780 [Chlamydiia bacterium]|nr:hypothetical protein [Chlamydiia bacterium]
MFILNIELTHKLLITISLIDISNNLRFSFDCNLVKMCLLKISNHLGKYE